MGKVLWLIFLTISQSYVDSWTPRTWCGDSMNWYRSESWMAISRSCHWLASTHHKSFLCFNFMLTRPLICRRQHILLLMQSMFSRFQALWQRDQRAGFPSSSKPIVATSIISKCGIQELFLTSNLARYWKLLIPEAPQRLWTRNQMLKMTSSANTLNMCSKSHLEHQNSKINSHFKTLEPKSNIRISWATKSTKSALLKTKQNATIATKASVWKSKLTKWWTSHQKVNQMRWMCDRILDVMERNRKL